MTGWIIKEFLLNWYCLMVITFNTSRDFEKNKIHKIIIKDVFFIYFSYSRPKSLC